MTRDRTNRRPVPAWAALVAGAMLAGCAMTAPENGTEIRIDTAAAARPALTPGKGGDAAGAVRNGLLRHPGVREAASLVSASADEVKVARAALFPSLGISLGTGVGAAGRQTGTVDLTGRQVIVDFGGTKRAIKAADIDLQIEYITFQKTVDTAIVDLLDAYGEVQMLRQLSGVRRAQFTAMRELQTLVAERAEAGATSSPEVLETRKRVQSAEFLLHEAESELAEAQDRLLRLSGQSRGGQIPRLRASCAAPSIGADELRIAHLRRAKAELKLEDAERARFPRISIEPLAQSPLRTGALKTGVNLSVESTLLQGGAISARANAARNTRDGAEAGVSAAERDAALDDRKLQREIAALERKSGLLDRQIALLAETRDLYRSQYLELGTRQLSELLDNEEEYYERQAERIATGKDLALKRVGCAARDQSLRKAMGLDAASLYGFPLGRDDL